MIDETFRQISSRESGQQYAQYLKGRRQEIAQLKQEEFEECYTALIGAAIKHIFQGADVDIENKLLGFF